MEFTEVVSPSVAVPVLCVLVCAFLVFAFGFKSPAQPPSFDVFDEDGKKKRLKKSKGSKSQSNGHAVVEGESSVKPQSSPRQATRQPAKSTSPTSTKAKLASQNADQSKKSKKQTQKDEETKQKQKVEEKKMQEIEDDTDGWHTIAKKDKKQKKKESEKQEVVQDETDMKEKETSPTPKSDDVSDLTQAKDTSEQTHAMEQRTKKKKEKKLKKAKPEEEVKDIMEAVQQQDQETLPDVTVQETTSVVEIQIKDAMETTVDELEVTESQDKIIEEQEIKEDKKDKNKDRKKDSPPPDDFVIPKSALEPEVEVSSLSPSSSKPDKSDSTSKSPKKKKKDKSKRREEKIEDIPVVEESQTGASGNVEASLSNTVVSSSIPPKSSGEIVQSEITQDHVVVPESSGADAASSQQVPAFDELGGQTDNWTEAKPKNKKKKARRAD